MTFDTWEVFIHQKPFKLVKPKKLYVVTNFLFVYAFQFFQINL